MRSLLLLGLFALVATLGMGDQRGERPCADLRGCDGAVQRVAFSPDGKWLASVDKHGDVRVWDIATRTVVQRLAPRGKTITGDTVGSINHRQVESVAFSPDGTLLAEATSESSLLGSARLWDPGTGMQVRMLAEGERNVREIVFSPDGKQVAFNARDEQGANHKIVLMEAATGQRVRELREPRLAVTRLAYSPDGTLLASAGATQVVIWDLATGKPRHNFSAHKKAIQAVQFSPDGRTLATAGSDDYIRLWSVETGKRERQWEAKQGGVNALVYSPSGRTIITAGDNNAIALWKPWSGKARRSLFAHVDDVISLDISKDGKLIASGSRDNTIALWNFSEPAESEDQRDREKEAAKEAKNKPDDNEESKP